MKEERVYGADCHELRTYVQNYAKGKFVTIDDIAEKFAMPVVFELSYARNAAENNRLARIAKVHIGLFGLSSLIQLATVLKAENMKELGIGTAIATVVTLGTIAHANYVEDKDVVFVGSQIAIGLRSGRAYYDNVRQSKAFERIFNSALQPYLAKLKQ